MDRRVVPSGEDLALNSSQPQPTASNLALKWCWRTGPSFRKTGDTRSATSAGHTLKTILKFSSIGARSKQLRYQQT